ncbi:MAG: O-antigen ligase family protein [bacterium]|nr:O-antigen ligase family protein [bacterium]
MFTKIARICTYISLAAPLIASKSIFFPFITGKILFFRLFTELALLAIAGAVLYGEIPLVTLKNTIKKPIFIAITLFTALFTLSAFTAQIPSFAFWSNFERGEGAWQIIHYFIFFFLITTLFQNKNDWRRLIGAQVIISALVGLYGVGQAFNWPSWIIDPPNTGLSVSGTLGSPSYFGIYMALSACFALWITFQSRGNKKLFWLLIASFECISFLMSQNRGSFAAAGIGAVTMLIIWLIQKKRSKKSYIGAGILAFLIVYGMGMLILTVKGGDAIQRFQPRLWTWESAFAGIIERPLTGWGAENFPFIFDKYYNPKHYQIESWFDRAHNTPLEYLTTGGIPLFLAYASIFIVLYVRLFRKRNGELFPFFAALPLIYLINGFAIFETLPIYLIFFLLIGLITAFTEDFIDHQSTRITGIHKKNATAQTIFIILTILTFVSLYATIYRPLQKNLMILETLRTNGKTDLEIFKEHEATLRYSSPVGTQEELQGLLMFTVSYFDYLRANDLVGQVSKEKIASIMKFNAEHYEQRKSVTIGLKTLYIRITGLLAAYQETKDAAYLTEADRLIAIGTATSPTRIEFVRFALASAALRGDKAAYTAANNKGKVLLPNYEWEPEMAKFVY